MKRESSPYYPLKRKAKGKETIPVFFQNPLSPRGRACACVGRYRLAGAAADELIERLGAERSADNRNLWAYYCYHHDIEILLEKADECASRFRQGEIRDPVTLFQCWLSRTYGKEAT